MRITENEIEKYNLSNDMLGAVVKFRYGKRGGQYICPICKKHIVVKAMPNVKKSPYVYGVDVIFCELCKLMVKPILKGAVRNGYTFGMLIAPNDNKKFAYTKKAKRDKFNGKIARDVVLGRLLEQIKSDDIDNSI